MTAETPAIPNIGLEYIPVSPGSVFLDGKAALDDNLSIGFSRLPNAMGLLSKLPCKPLMNTCILCLEGHLDFRINQTDISIYSGDLMVAISGMIFEKAYFSEDIKVVFMSFEDGIAGMTQTLGLSSRNMVSEKSLLYRPVAVHFDKEKVDNFVSLYKSVKYFLQSLEPGLQDEGVAAVMGFIRLILYDCISGNRKLNKGADTREESVFVDFIQRVNSDAIKERSVSYYADKACLSPKYFARVVKKVSGKKPIEWIRDRVILEAKTLLTDPSYSVQQVADMMSFPNSSFFCKYFRSATGLSPNAFRKSVT